jgi:hypothetical protein
MRTAGEDFLRYAKAERELCEMAGAVLTNIIKEIEIRHGIRIAELRVTMDRAHSLNGWPAANCVMVREEEVDAARETESEREIRPLIAMLERRP